MLPKDHWPYTDKYFLRTNEILKKEAIDPVVSIFLHPNKGCIAAGKDELEAVLLGFSSDKGCRLWFTKRKRLSKREPFAVIKARAQRIVELETLYLGLVSSALADANSYPVPSVQEIADKMSRLKAIYGDIPIIYFGARHHHWRYDREFAQAAIRSGAVQTSTDNGSQAIAQEGAGTMPHALAIILASVYGKQDATRKAAELFDKHMPADIPRITLVDTFAREITDSLAVARYFGSRKNMMRIDTCGESYGEGSQQRAGDGIHDGKGVTVELTANVRQALIEAGMGSSTGLFLSSGFGDEGKAQAFCHAEKDFRKKTGYSLFEGVGIGDLTAGLFATADVYEVDGKPLAKTGRKPDINLDCMERIL